MLLALGLFVFDLSTMPFEELSRRTSWKHVRSARVGDRDASQYLGPGDDSVSLSGALMPEAFGTFAALRSLREMADTGEAWPLVIGTGRVLGNFVILDLDERQKYFMADGVPRRTDFTINLDRVS